MFILDRYALRLFIKVLLVSFCSITGLIIIVTSVENLDEFITLGRRQGSYAKVLFEFFSPRILTIFDIMYPSELTSDSALVFMPHGNSFEFIEDVFTSALRKLGVQEDVRAYYSLFGGNPEQTTLAGAEFLIAEQVKHPSAVAMARRGAAVVVPANCWGDGGRSNKYRVSVFCCQDYSFCGRVTFVPICQKSGMGVDAATTCPAIVPTPAKRNPKDVLPPP